MIIDNPIVSGSLNVQNNVTASNGLITNDLTVLGTINATIEGTSATASYVEFSGVANAPTLLSGSEQIATEISGAFDSTSSSLASRISNQEGFSSSLDATFATDADLNLVSSSVDSLNAATSSYALKSEISGSFTDVSSSIAEDIANISTDFADITNKPTLLSGSAQIASDISGSFTDLSSSLEGRVSSNESSINSINSASSSYALANQISGSFTDLSSSLASELLKNTSDTLTGDLTVTGTVTAQEFHTEYVSSSIIFESGSTQFGNSSDDTHIFSGSIKVHSTAFNQPVGLNVTSDGKVGIGAATPTYNLDVNPNVGATPAIRLRGYSSTLRLQTYNSNQYGRILFASDVAEEGEIKYNYQTDSIHFKANQTDNLLIISSSGLITGSRFAGIFEGALSSSAQIASDISGSFTDLSSSLEGRVSSNEGSVSSLNSATSSYALQNQISGSFTDLSSSLEGRISDQESFSSSLDATFATDADLNLVSSSVDSLNAASSSYALKAEISGSTTELSSSIASNIEDILDGTDTVTSASYALTASYADSGAGFPFSGSAIITGSLLVSQSNVDFTSATGVSGSFSGSFVGDGSQLSGVTSYTDSDTLSYINSIGVVSGSAQVNSGSFSGSFEGDGSGLTGIEIAATNTVTASFTSTGSVTIVHSFNSKNVSVNVYDENDILIIPQQVTLLDNNNVKIDFGGNTTGFAVLAKGGHLVSGSVPVPQLSTVTDSFTSSTSHTVTHNFNTKDVIVSVYEGDDLIIPDSITTDDVDNVTVTFPEAVTGRVVVVKSGHIVSGSIPFDNLLSSPFEQSTSAVTASKHIVPSQDITYDLGSSDLRFRDIYLSSASIYLGNTTLTEDNLVTTASLQSALPAGTLSGSFQIHAEISGAFDDVSSSLASRVADQESFSSSLDNTFATDSDLNLVSSSVDSLNAASSSYALETLISGSFTSVSSSIASTLLKNTTDTLTGDLTVTGTLTAQDLHVQEVTSSIVYSSGSNIFGNSTSDTQTFNGGVGIGITPYSSAQLSINSGTRDYILYGQSSDANAFISLRDDSSSTNVIFGAVGNNHVFMKDTTEHMRINSSGQVGIGTASPYSNIELDVYGDISLAQQNWALRGNSNNADLVLEELNGSTLNDSNIKLQFKSGGNVYITKDWTPGNPSRLVVRGDGSYNNTFSRPGATLQVISDELSNDTWSPVVNIAVVRQSLTTGRDSFGGIGFSSIDDSNNNGQYDAARIAVINESPASVVTPTSLAFYTNAGVSNSNAATEQVRINSSGSLGIGTTAPTHQLTVDETAGSSYALSARNFNDNLQIKLGTTTSGYANIQTTTVNANTAYNMSIQADGGNVGIGTNNPNIAKLQVQGSVYSTTSVQGANAVMKTHGGHAIFGSNSSAVPIALGRDAGNLDLVVSATGNIGIKASQPTSILHIENSDAEAVVTIEKDTVTAGTTIGTLRFVNSGATNTYASVAGGRNSDGDGMLTLKGGGSSGLHILESGQMRTLNRDFAKESYYGYSSGYKALVLGSTGTNTSTNSTTVAIGYDPIGNAYSGFSGDGREVLFRRGAQFATPNSADNSMFLYNLVLKDGHVGIANNNPLFELCIGAADAPNRNMLEIAVSSADTGTNIIQNYNRATAAYTPLNIAGSYMTFGVGSNATERMRITGDGTVAIGNPSSVATAAKLQVGDALNTGSSAALQVNGFVRIEHGLLIHWDSDNTQAGYLQYGGTNGFSFTTEGAGSGKVGIGTTSPAQHLHVFSGGTNIAAKFESNDGTGGIMLADSTGNVELTTSGTNGFNIQPGGGVSRFRVDGNGMISHKNSHTDHSLRREFTWHNGGISNGTTVDLIENASAYTDITFIAFLEIFHSSRTYKVIKGSFGGYGYNVTNSGNGLGLGQQVTGTGTAKLQFSNTSGNTASAHIHIIIYGDPSITVHNGYLSSAP